MIVILDVLVHTRFERVKVGRLFDIEMFGLQGSEEDFNDRIVQAIALSAYALLDAVTGELLWFNFGGHLRRVFLDQGVHPMSFST